MIQLLAFLVFCVGVSGVAPGEEMAVARAVLDKVAAFTASLDEAQRQQAALPFEDETRLTWSFLPGDRQGLPLKSMTDAQRAALLDVLRVALSAEGFQTVRTIQELEEVLRGIENSQRRDPEMYYVLVFGEPSLDQPWGLRYEGHHTSLNWTMAGGRVIASSPQFLGANPAEVPSGALKGTRALAAEEDLARNLVKSLSEVQRQAGVLDATAPPDILTRMEREAAIQEDRGIAYAELTAEQQTMLMGIIEHYANVQAPELVAERLKGVREAGLPAVKFAWMGGLERGQGHYYRVQGPTFLIEYDNTQNNANHVHCVWRDFKGDFGLDVLRKHYQQHAAASDTHGHNH
ncbi:MAG: DUF3500 domain-containing protein [Candidatus Hydrogenedentes bacterium]|nr:DUF3500 domain-containing protein [Candidatus Hydrogenedentota bacterium]